MYFFLCNLSIIDICFSSTIVPKILINALAKDRSISLWGRATQMYFSLALGATECIILAVMAYNRSHQVNHFFCEMPPFCRLSCQDMWLNEIVMYSSEGIIAMCSFCLTLISYFQIISTILKIHSSQGRHEAFSTCASHLTVVALYYGTIMFMYLRPRSTYSPETDKTVSHSSPYSLMSLD
ncbi:hypothetical protein AB205_0016200, partial [Aquarana catesbeiana]